MTTTRREFLLVALFFLALAILVTWPLSRHAASQVADPGSGVEVYTGLYVLTWGIHALANDPIHYFDANNFFPHAQSLAFGEHLFGQALLLAPVQWTLATPALTWNLGVLLSFVLAATGAYFLARQITGSVPAGLTAGLLYGFSPFRMDHLAGMHVLALAGLPWLFLIAHLYLETRQRRLIYLAAFFSWLQVVACTYSLYYLLLALVPGLLALLLPRFSRLRQKAWSHRMHFLLSGVGAAVLLLPLTTPYLNHDLEQALTRVPDSAATGAAESPGTLASLDEGFFTSLFQDMTARPPDIDPGLVALFLLAVLVVVGLADGSRLNREIFYYAPVAALAMIAGTGMHLRFIGLVSLCLAVLAAIGVQHLGRLSALVPRGAWLLFLVPLAVIIDIFPEPVSLHAPVPRTGPPPVYLWLDTTEEGATLAEFPVPADDTPARLNRARRQFYSTYHWRRAVDGEAPRTTPLTRSIRERLARFPDDTAIAQLRALRIDFALVHLDEYPGELRDALTRQLAGRPELALERVFESTLVYRVNGVDASR